MASISGVSSSNSIYGNKNVISGLASGMDTEAMIENSVSGYKAKITALGQKQTTLLWKQESYRSMISKMNSLTQKYTSYTSSTNLFSSGFFDRAVSVTPQGTNAGAVSATGKSNSTITIDSIKQLATNATYLVGSSSLGGASGMDIPTISASTAIDLNDTKAISSIHGTMTFNYGNKEVSIKLEELDVYTTTEELTAAIKEKLSEQKVANSSGEMISASELIDVKLSSDGKTVSFEDKKGAGNSVYIKSVSKGMQNNLGITPGETATAFTVADPAKMQEDVHIGKLLSGKTLEVNLDGVKKTITLPTYPETGGTTSTDFVKGVQAAFDKAYGKDKVAVGNLVSDGKVQLNFTTAKGSTMSIGSNVGLALGFDTNLETSYVNTGKTLGDLGVLNGMQASGKDENGNDYYALTINDVEVGRFTKDSSLESVLSGINNSAAGVNVSYSKTTNQFQFKARDSGVAGRVDFGSDLGTKLFGGGTKTDGKDSIFTATINDAQVEMTRSTNVVNIEGLNVTLNKAFGFDSSGAPVANTEAVSFTTKSDTDTVIKAVKSFVEDYNAMVTELREAFRTVPAQKSNGSKYDPLTDDDLSSMSESAIKSYEEKAKRGILFADGDLSSLYNKLTAAITPSGSDGGAMRAIGLSSKYAGGLTTLDLDESKLRSALEANPDSVKDVFAKTKEGGASTDGLMQKLKTQLDTYSSTSLASTGILVRKAGSPLSVNTLRDNTWQKQLNELDSQIERWQGKMSDKVDYYTRQFTQLEQLMAQMNSQSSSLSSLMGGSQ